MQREKTYAKEKNHTHKWQDSIYVIRQFAYVNLLMSTELQGFHYSQEKMQDATIQFSLSKQHKTLISKKIVFISCAQDSQSLQNGLKIFELSLKKSIIKNYNNIISSWVIIQIKYN